MYSPENISLVTTDFHFKKQKSVYRGKVRDVYDLGDQLIIIASDRISAFDYILPRPIPYKGQVLNLTAAHFLNSVKEICPVWLTEVPDPNVSIGKKCKPIPLEMVVRGYLAGHAWREYKSGKKGICGIEFESGMKENQKFKYPIITPATKASSGHDEDISLDEIIEAKLVNQNTLEQLCDYSLRLFEKGTMMASERGLILVDTKYEFGLFDGEVILMDEIHTPDSSRYFETNSYEGHFAKDLPQKQLSKEFVREWLIAHGFQGKEDQLMPEMPDLFVWHVSDRYIELYERITGTEFIKPDAGESIQNRISAHLQKYL